MANSLPDQSFLSRQRQAPGSPTAAVSSTKSLFSFSLKMHVLAGVLLVSGLQLARAHGGHSEGDRVAGETIQQYAQRHVSVVGLLTRFRELMQRLQMSTEHHMCVIGYGMQLMGDL